MSDSVRTAATILLLSALSASPACGARDSGAQPTPQTTPPAQAASAVPRSATCALLSNEEIESVQGEPPADAQGSEHLSGALVTSQCFYRLPTFNKSINIEVTRPAAGAVASTVAEFWRKTFSRDAAEGRERERERKEKDERERELELERERAAGGTREGGHREEREEGEEEAAPPRRIAGIGDAAYWIRGHDSAALSVLRKDAIIRLSVGGAEDDDARLEKSKTLARKILRHF
ncbi:MAG TPA: hypothetical protein VLJ61_12915 [Pyrinomonadaceae bacterium]|nr:hypothetical protein [Pyrinomonadaceae bacterium]